MRNVLLYIGLLISLAANADSQSLNQIDEIYAKTLGTCTSKTCSPGTVVTLLADRDDNGTATGIDEKEYDLASMSGREFEVKGDDEKCQQCSWVIDKRGNTFSIQRMFLKKK